MTDYYRRSQHDPWCDHRRRATEGIAAWLSRLPGGLAAYLPAESASPQGTRPVADRLHAFARDVITTNPVTREPLSPVQIHLLELVLDAVDWPVVAAATGPLAEGGAEANGPEARGATRRQGGSS